MYIHILNPNAFCVGLYTLHTKHHIVITLIVCITKHTRSLRKSLLRGNLTEVILNTSNTLKDVLHMEKDLLSQTVRGISSPSTGLVPII